MFWSDLWKRFQKHRIGYVAYLVILLFLGVAIWAPFLASSRPIFCIYQGEFYFPLFRYLFFQGFYTKRLDIFFNLLCFTLPLGALLWKLFKRKIVFLLVACFQIVAFFYLVFVGVQDPAKSLKPPSKQEKKLLSWATDLLQMSSYEKLNLILREVTQENYHQSLVKNLNQKRSEKLSTLFEENQILLEKSLERQKHILKETEKDSPLYNQALANQKYLLDKTKWIKEEKNKLSFVLMPFFRPFHWEEDAGGDPSLNASLSFWNLSRINHKDLTAALIFGARISLIVGLLSTLISFVIGVPLGAFSGYYGGRLDMIVCRLLEIWESMPVFFMLLLIVAITESKSIFLVILVIGLFGWTAFSRYIRGEFFKQRHLLYIEACHSLGFKDRHIIFSHILPNAIPPVLTLLPFAIMGAITSEAGLSFLGLGEEDSCSWGVLMDEGRSVFPGQSNLLWPPAILLTTLLIAIALVGDALRDVIDPHTIVSQEPLETLPSDEPLPP